MWKSLKPYLRCGSLVFSLAVCCLAVAPAAQAVINDWTNSAGGAWETTNNWSLGVLPDNTTTTRINVAGTYTVTVGDAAASGFPSSFTNVQLDVHSTGLGEPTLDFNYTNAVDFRLTGSTSLRIGAATVNWNAPNATFLIGALFQINPAGFASQGVFNVQAGNVSVNGSYAQGGPFSTVNVYTGATFTVTSSDTRIGSGGVGVLNILGGTFVTSNTLQLGQSSISTGRVVMVNGNIVIAGAGGQLSIGAGPNQSASQGYGEVIISNGTLRANSGREIRVASGPGSRGDLRVFGGTVLQGGIVRVGYGEAATNTNLVDGAATGTVQIAGGAWIASNQWFIGAHSNSLGTVNLSAGTVTFNAANLRMDVGQFTDSTGELNVSGGLLQFTTNTFLSIGVGTNSVGRVTVTGGRIDLVNNGPGLVVGSNDLASAQLILEGGRVELTKLTVGSAGILSNRTGGVLQFVGTDIVSGPGAANRIVDGGTLSYKNYSALNVTGAVAKFSIVSGSGLQLHSSTNVNIVGAYVLTNAAGSFKELSLTGTNPKWNSDALQITDGSRLHVTNATGARVASVVTNQGTVLVQNSTVTFEKPLLNVGRYISDPSTNTFLDHVTVAPSGSLEGGAGDVFEFRKSLLIHSTNNTDFNLRQSTVLFSGSASHTNLITGVDRGSNTFVTDFSYGTLRLGTGGGGGDQIFFGSGDGAASNALYVYTLDLLGTTNNVANLHTLGTNINVYYMISQNNPANTYLMDMTYTLDGGGLLPPAVPEPSTILFLTVACAIFWRRIERK